MSHSTVYLECVRPDFPRGTMRHALFDFDGTLSLIRQGWQSVMIPMMVEVLVQTPRHEPQEELQRLVREFVDRTTGVQTIYQMMGLQEMVRERGGDAQDPLDYKRQYLERLSEHIRGRIEALRAGSAAPRDLTVRGAREMLEALDAHGVTCYLASGTDVGYVRDEATALGLAEFFEGRIYGAVDDWKSYSKAKVIQQILSENGLEGPELVTFGDGFVEIEETVRAGGTAVGVASDEVRQDGRVDPWKRERLIAAGAHLIVPDFGRYHELLRALLPASTSGGHRARL